MTNAVHYSLICGRHASAASRTATTATQSAHGRFVSEGEKGGDFVFFFTISLSLSPPRKGYSNRALVLPLTQIGGMSILNACQCVSNSSLAAPNFQTCEIASGPLRYVWRAYVANHQAPTADPKPSHPTQKFPTMDRLGRPVVRPGPARATNRQPQSQRTTGAPCAASARLMGEERQVTVYCLATHRPLGRLWCRQPMLVCKPQGTKAMTTAKEREAEDKSAKRV